VLRVESEGHKVGGQVDVEDLAPFAIRDGWKEFGWCCGSSDPGFVMRRVYKRVAWACILGVGAER